MENKFLYRSEDYLFKYEGKQVINYLIIDNYSVFIMDMC